MAQPRSYADILEAGTFPAGTSVSRSAIARSNFCLLIAPHGGGVEPGSSEIMRAVVEVGGWAWYEFAGFLRQGNKEALHMPSASFDEPTLKSMLPQAGFVIAFHGASESRRTRCVRGR